MTGYCDKVEKELIPALKNAYQISFSLTRQMGDELTFLKRRHVLVSEELMLIKSHHNNVAQLKGILGIHPKAYPKKTPAHPAMDNEGNSENLNEADMGKFRSAAGRLGKLSCGLASMSACYSFSGKQDDVSYSALLASAETPGVVSGWKPRAVFEFELQGRSKWSVS